MKDVRVIEVRTAEGNALYDQMTVKLAGDDGFAATLRVRTNDRAGLAFELGRAYRLAFTEVPEVQAATPAD